MREWRSRSFAAGTDFPKPVTTSGKKFGGMEVSDAKRLKALEAENARLKKLLAESMLENDVTREALRKSGRRTGSTRGGTLDEATRIVGAACAASRRDECEFVALSASAGSQWRGDPKVVRTDNGKEFCDRAMMTWAHERQVALRLIEPGKPNQNAYIESFNGRLRDECLNEHGLTSLARAATAIGGYETRGTRWL